MSIPNRITAFGPLSPQQELALAQEMLALQSEEELDHFLPLILPALKLAAPLLKGVAGSLLGGLGGGGGGGGGESGGSPRRARRQRPRTQQEYFLGNIVKGLFGEMQPENEEEEQFLGNILKGLMGEQEVEGEEEQFLGGLIGKLFGGKKRELESETAGETENNYVQEQFLGGIIGKLFGGRELETTEAEMQMEEEASGGAPSPRRLRHARRFVRLAHSASRRAAEQIASLGHKPTLPEARRIVLGAIITAARRINPRMASAFAGHESPSPQPTTSGPSDQEEEGTMLELMLSGPGATTAPRGRSPGASRGQATWIRRGDRIIVSF